MSAVCAPAAVATPQPEPAEPTWQELVSYYISCLVHEDGFDELLQRRKDRSRYAFPRSPSECVFSDPTAGLLIDDNIAALVAAAGRQGESVFYGYPVVVQVDSSGSTNYRKLGCLLTMELSGLPAGGASSSGRLLPRGDEPFFHAALLAKLGFKSEQQAALAQKLPLANALGSAEALRDYLRELIPALEVPVIGALDPTALDLVDEGGIDGVGVHNVAMVFRGTATAYKKRLLEELTFLRTRGSEVAATAAAHLVGGAAPVASPDCTGPQIVCPLPTNDAQRAALEAAMSRPLTVVTGPPGTGKSQLVTNIVASAWASKQSVLVVSTNNQAVDVACARAQNLHPGLVVRTGSKEHREKAKESLSGLLSRRAARPDGDAVRSAAAVARQRLEAIRKRFDERTGAELRLAEVVLGQEQLGRLLGGALALFVQSIPKCGGARKLLRRLRRTTRAKLLRAWRMERLSRAAGLAVEGNAEVLDRYLELEVERATLRAALAEHPDTAAMVRAIVEAEHDVRQTTGQMLQSLAADSADQGRAPISRFVQARVAYNHNGLAVAFPALLPHLHGWASTALAIGATMPLRPALFDLVVIDEASQCAIPTLLPALFRAKRAVIIGDPQQLAHIAGLTRSDDDAKAKEAGLDVASLRELNLVYNRHSIYDAMARRAPQLHLLDEHYRSHPQIIQLSNKLFYEGRLTILTDPSGLLDFGQHAVAWRNVNGKAQRPEAGSAVNREEAAEVVAEVVRLVREKRDASVGVVTPFSAQARLIQTSLEKALTAEERERAGLAVGTAHRFQGDEKDVIVFSPVASAGIPEQTLAWLSGTPNLFNVALTRARSYLLVVGNQKFCSSMEGPLGELSRYVNELRVTKAVRDAGNAGRLHSEAEARLYEALLRRGAGVRPKALVLGYECDFVMEAGNRIINIECDGRHHFDSAGRQRLQDRTRDALIARQGWDVVRVPAWKCLSDPDAAVAEVLALVPSAMAS